SGPFGPVTTPPMSSLSMATAGVCWASSLTARLAQTPAIARTVTPRDSAVFRVMMSLLSRSGDSKARCRGSYRRPFCNALEIEEPVTLPYHQGFEGSQARACTARCTVIHVIVRPVENVRRDQSEA